MENTDYDSQSLNEASPRKTNILLNSQKRKQRLKQIDELYKSQISKIYKDSQEATQKQMKSFVQNKQINNNNRLVSKRSQADIITNKQENKNDQIKTRNGFSPKLYKNTFKSFSLNDQNISNVMANNQDKFKLLISDQPQKTKKFEYLRRQNQVKQNKIVQLSKVCQKLIYKLKKYIDQKQFSQQLKIIRQCSHVQDERIQFYFKTKSQQFFFKMKLQILGLLHDFQISNQDISLVNQQKNEVQLFNFFVKKIKIKLKDIKSKQQQSNFQTQKDKIMNQKYQQRINYLIQTNELLKLGQSKLKQKNQELRAQMNTFIHKIKQKQHDLQQKENKYFCLKRQFDQLNGTYQKINFSQKNLVNGISDERKSFQTKQKQLKGLISNYFLQKKKIQNELQQKQTFIKQLLMKIKFLQQQNDRVNRQFIKWKQRYEWIQKQKQCKVKEYEEQKHEMIRSFQEYKEQNNPNIIMEYRAEVIETNKKYQQLQEIYKKNKTQIDLIKSQFIKKQLQVKNIIQSIEENYSLKLKELQNLKNNQMLELQNDHYNRINQIREQNKKKDKLLGQQMQIRTKALLNQHDKRMRQQLAQIQNQNDQLRKQIQSLNKVLQVKQSLINIITKKKDIFDKNQNSMLESKEIVNINKSQI